MLFSYYLTEEVDWTEVMSVQIIKLIEPDGYYRKQPGWLNIVGLWAMYWILHVWKIEYDEEGIKWVKRGKAGHWTLLFVCQKLENSGDDINDLFSKEMQKWYPCYTVS